MSTNQKEIKELRDDILALTMEIKDKYPELYRHLGETPWHASGNNKGIDLNSLEEYLHTIQSLLNDRRKRYRIQYID